MAMTDSVEAVLTEIGFGRWQGLVLAMALIVNIIVPMQQLSSPLLSAPVPFHCSYPESIQVANLTNTTRFGYSNGLTNDETSEFPSQCLEELNAMDYGNIVKSKFSLDNPNKRATGLPSCPMIEYDMSTFESTVITEWNLVCESSSFRPLFQMTYSIGAILGSLFCGQLSDWSGRKRTIQIGSLLTITTVLTTSVAPWYSAMVTMRILTGVGSILMLFPTYTLLSEVTPPSSRTITALVPGMIYSSSVGILACIAYVVPHWRKLLLIGNSPLLILVPLTFVIDESPRWLLQKERTAEAVAILRKAAAQNRVTLSFSNSLLLDGLSQICKDMKKLGGGKDVESQGTLQMMRDGFSSTGMRTILIVTPCMWFLQRSLYVGIILNANNYSSSPFEYLAFSGAISLVAILLSIPISLKLPRRIFLAGALSIGGILLLLELLIPSAYWLAKWSMVMGSFCLVCGAFQVNYIFVAELFPTVMRTRGFTFTNLIGAIGELSIPLVTDIAVQYQWWAPSVTFGLTGIVGSIILSLLPETKDRPMPETLHDVEVRYRNKYKGFGSDVMVTNKQPVLDTALSVLPTQSAITTPVAFVTTATAA